MVFSYIAPSPALQDFVRDYLTAHFYFGAEEPAPLKRYAPKPEQGITFFVRGRPSIVNPQTGQRQFTNTTPNTWLQEDGESPEKVGTRAGTE